MGLKSPEGINVPEGPSWNINWFLCLELREHMGTMTPKFETLILDCVCFTYLMILHCLNEWTKDISAYREDI